MQLPHTKKEKKKKSQLAALDLPCSFLFFAVVQVEDIVGHILSHLTTYSFVFLSFLFHFISFLEGRLLRK
jgi:hypothetical protein